MKIEDNQKNKRKNINKKIMGREIQNMIHLGVSYIGFIFLLMLFIPNAFWMKNKPKDYDTYVKNENKILVCLERIGEVLVCCIALIFSDFNLRPLNIWSVWLGLAVLAMIGYEYNWVQYFKSEKNMTDFYSSFLGIPVAGASLPVAAFGFLGIYGCNIFMLIAVLILGIGHIGIHLGHRKEVYTLKKKNLPIRILRGILVLLLALVFFVIAVTIEAKNYHWIKDCVKSANGIEEEGYIELGGQEQYYVIRGEDVSNPVIIWIHGGPANPDTMETFYFSNYLKENYTVIAWNQRGCGRTYFKNKEKDPNNETADFGQIQEDLDELVDYARERFGQDKVILVGHSFGTMVGSKYAIDHPDKVTNYIGVGQMGALGSDAYAYQDALEKAISLGDDTTELEHAFERYQKDPTIENMLAVRSFADRFHEVPMTRDYLLDAYTSPYMGVDDIRWYLLQLNLREFVQLNQSLFDYINEKDVYDYGTEFQMPVVFISGSCDWVTPVDCTREYYNSIEAPNKRMELIEGWGHMVPLENPEEFANVLMDMIVK